MGQDIEDVPTMNELRETLKRMTVMIDRIDLARAIKTGDRIEAFLPFRDWLLSGDHPHLHLRQMLEVLLDAAVERGDRDTVSAVVGIGVDHLRRK